MGTVKQIIVHSVKPQPAQETERFQHPRSPCILLLDHSPPLPYLDIHSLDFFLTLFILGAVPGLSCGTWDLQSSLWHARYLVVACKLLVAARGIQFLDQGLNPRLQHWELAVFATGPPRKPLHFLSTPNFSKLSKTQSGADHNSLAK